MAHFKVKKRPAGWAVYKYENGSERYVPKGAWPAGVQADMSLEQARSVVKSLTASAHIVAQEARRTRIIARVRGEAERKCAWLPEDVVAHFERIHLAPKASRPGYQKLVSMWKLTRKLIVEVNMSPEDWPDEPLPLYDWFVSNPRGTDYVRRVFRLLNKYGRMFCRKRGLAFEPAALPPDETMREVEAKFTGEKKSLPLLPEHLKGLKQTLTEEEFRWINLTFHFGLRPEETCLAKAEKDSLVVDQPKLRKIKPAQRLKHIPALTAGQKEALRELKKGLPMKRPSRKRVEGQFPEGITLYGCRHGFTHQMQKLGYSLEQISAWLGHRSLATTQRYYQDHNVLKAA